jgi:hypothetical protein
MLVPWSGVKEAIQRTRYPPLFFSSSAKEDPSSLDNGVAATFSR